MLLKNKNKILISTMLFLLVAGILVLFYRNFQTSFSQLKTSNSSIDTKYIGYNKELDSLFDYNSPLLKIKIDELHHLAVESKDTLLLAYTYFYKAKAFKNYSKKDSVFFS